MKFGGYDVKAQLLDLDGDGKPELVVSSFEVPLRSAVTGGQVVRNLFVYRPDPREVFQRRPALKHAETLGARDARALGVRIRLGADLLGRGLADAVRLESD